MRRLFLMIGLYISCHFMVLSQNKGHFSVALSPGLMYYQGDLSGSSLPNLKTSHLSAGLDFGYRPGRLIMFTLGYQYGKISGADSLVPSHESRNLHFYSNVHEIRVLTYVNLLEIYHKIRPKKLVKKVDFKPGFDGPQLILGCGYFMFNPKGELDGTDYNLQKLGTEGQNIASGGYDDPYNLWGINLKYGLAVDYNLSRQFSLQLQFVYTQTFTDYLDDVSGNYPEYDKLIKTTNGDIASYFAYGGRDGSVVSPDINRGNDEKNDGFINMSIKLTYTFGRAEFGRLMKL